MGQNLQEIYLCINYKKGWAELVYGANFFWDRGAISFKIDHKMCSPLQIVKYLCRKICSRLLTVTQHLLCLRSLSNSSYVHCPSFLPAISPYWFLRNFSENLIKLQGEFRNNQKNFFEEVTLTYPLFEGVSVSLLPSRITPGNFRLTVQSRSYSFVFVFICVLWRVKNAHDTIAYIFVDRSSVMMNDGRHGWHILARQSSKYRGIGLDT